MVNNIKTEIIYYGLPTDFEFEFNLCGNCQMRLLTSTADDNSSLLKALQRSITRSRVIIIVGNLDGENGTISLISKSIGYACENIDTNMYDVKETDNIKIIKNSVPLITDGGEFGGCIIESGPQSMIFLSEDKKIRKEIMTNLVHGYIKDLSDYPIQAAEVQTPTVLPEEVEESDDVIEEIEEATVPEVIEEIEETVEAEDTEELIEEVENLPEEEEKETVSDSENDPFNINNLLTNDKKDEIDIQDTESIIYEDDDFTEPKQDNHQRNSKIFDIVTLILSIILLITLAFIIYSYIYLPLHNGISIGENFQNIFSFLLD